MIFAVLALALPEATEAAHMAHPDFRVRNKIFATLWCFSPVPGGLGTTWIDQRQAGSRGRDEFNQRPANGLAQKAPGENEELSGKTVRSANR